ncbi:zinc finger protein GAI-ASSOCIATED FACTOR 1-like [Malania oleifera]|uniref:zinc finger protein GAI-ASSOCIATED FACTOR 1-like n=1 Tax=Malania oleifera TaxID=397392 RepID=UPI0025AD9CE3|nr:zinc finger protein GAI-ASSOCIATED FACTOR 1-like [Malania oleifera]
MVELENSSPVTVSTASAEASVSSSGNQTMPAEAPPKKKRNLPGMPDPNAEVIALSPKTLMATNRFVCEICNKGFQRDQNLQLHRRGHNLPWKLRQRTSKEIRKRVYVCPEPSCVHHSPSRALGDLTGIKKHFCRKHGEKKWKCERCSKKYAVQSDWKAHLKTCGTREYKCDCGTLFSRRDSFVTHRAFCDALAEEGARAHTLAIPKNANENVKLQTTSSPPPPPPPLVAPPTPPVCPATNVITPVLSIQNPELPENPVRLLPRTTAPMRLTAVATTTATATSSSSGNPTLASNSSSSTRTPSVFASVFAPSTTTVISQSPQVSSSFSNLISGAQHLTKCTERPTTSLAPIPTAEPISLCLSSPIYFSNASSSLFPALDQDHHRHYAQSPQPPAMSATALLQKAAQMGAAASKGSWLHGLGLAISSPTSGQQDHAATTTTTNTTTTATSSITTQWNSGQIEPESTASVAAGLGLGLPSRSTGSALTDLMMGPPSLFGNKPTTLDLLGLGIGAGGASTGELSALLTSMGGGIDVATAAAAAASFGGASSQSPGEKWEGPPERKPNRPALL